MEGYVFFSLFMPGDDDVKIITMILIGIVPQI